MYFSKNGYKTEILANGMLRTIMVKSGKLMSMKMELKKGQKSEPHQHIHEQICYILSGKFEFEIQDEKYVCSEGDSLFFPSNVIHGCTCLEDGILLDTFTPIREDLLS